MAPQNSTVLHENIDFNALDLSPIKHSKTITEDVAEISSLKSSDVYEIIESVKSMNRFSKLADSQVDDEIPIWICGEPRFISGITNTTTCKHLIQALIDDELNSSSADVAASRELSDYVITEKWRDVEQALPGDTKILPIWMAWGSARREVKFKLKINKNRAETETIDIDNNDNRDTNQNDKRYKELEELRRRKAIHVSHLLKRLIDQGESIKAQLNMLKSEGKDPNNRSDPRKNFLLESFLRDAAKHQCQITLPNATTPKTIIPKWDHQPIESKTNPIIPVKCTRNRITTATATSFPDDELFLVIDDKSGDDDSQNDSAVHVEYRQYYLNKKLQIATAKANNVNGMDDTKVQQHIEMTSKRKSISKMHEFDDGQRKRFNKRLIKYLSDDFNHRVPKHCMEQSYQSDTTGLNNSNNNRTIHHGIDQMLQELHELIAHEEHLMKELSIKCEQYHNQNNKYITKLRLELSVDEIQNNLDVYAKEIIDNELELYKIQNEIRKKCGILCNLQRMNDKSTNTSANDNNAVERKRDPIIKPKNIYRNRDYNNDDSGTFFDSTNNKSIII